MRNVARVINTFIPFNDDCWQDKTSWQNVSSLMEQEHAQSNVKSHK